MAHWHEGKNMFAELARGLPAIVEVFLEKGYSEEDCSKIMGGNFFRLLNKTIS
jgi:microsomal dipeptidase-like Zn-dependent dipeptidase